MDLVERIESTRFLGQEFLLWLWFKSELFQATLTRTDGSALELWFDTQLMLQSVSDVGERTTMRGVAPSGTLEAKVAIQRGKLPLKACVKLSTDGKDFSFLFEASTFGLSAVKLPEVITEPEEERIAERMHLLALLDDVLSEQYLEFLLLRRSEHWEDTLCQALVQWTHGEETLSDSQYLKLVHKVQAHKPQSSVRGAR
jgi:hypothetical protein